MKSRRTHLKLLSASTGALAALLCASPAGAWQQNACGGLVDGKASCPADGENYSQGIRYDASGDIAVELGDGLALAPEAGHAGIIVISDVDTNGAVTIDGAGASIVTRDAIGAVVEAEGDVLIDLASVSTEAVTPGEIAAGILAVSTFGSTTVNVGSVQTSGDYSTGIIVQNGSAGAVRIDAGSISTTGFAADGIAVVSGGLTEINVDTIEGNGDYIWGVNVANGIISEEQPLSGDTYVNVGRINLRGDNNAGVVVRSNSGAFINIGELQIDGVGSTGVHAAAMGPVRVRVDKAVFKGEQTGGIVALAELGDAYVQVGSLSAENGPGVAAVSTFGAAAVDAGTVSVEGELAIGVQAVSNYGNASIRVDDVSTNGLLATGIGISATRGKLSVIAGNVSTRGDGAYGVQATGKTNLIQLKGNLSTTGERAAGILSATTRGDNISLVQGDVSTSGGGSDGLWVIGRYGTADVRASGSISTSGDRSMGIRAGGEDGQVIVEAQNVATSGANSNGIHARTRFIGPYLGYFPGEPVPFTGNIDIRAANVTVTGERSIGISAKGIGNAAILAGNISAASGPAIETDMIGTVSLDLRGDVRSDGASAISATAKDVAIEIGASARVRGAQDGLFINAVGTRCIMRDPSDGSPNPCPNPGEDGLGGEIGLRAGAIDAAPAFPGFAGNAHVVNRGAVEAGEGYAVRVEAGTIRLENSGQITGAVKFGGGDDQFDNRGIFTVTKSSDFGSGVDVFRNQGTLRHAGGAVRLDGLDRFENSGLIDLRNGAVGDVLTLPGDYIGRDGAVVRFDIDAEGQASDQLRIGGSAAGTTMVALSADPAEAKLTGARGVTLIEVAGAASADAFVLAEATRDIGLVRYALVHDAAEGAYSLVGRAGAGAYRQLGTLQASDHMWDASADLWRLHGLARRDSWHARADDAAAPRLWGSLQSGRVSRDWSSSDGGESVDLGYRQTRQGGQLGYDLLGSSNDAGMLRIGLTGGYSSTKLGYRGAADRIRLSTVNMGLYAGYVRDRLFANLLVKYDRHAFKIDTSAFASTQKLDGSTWGADGEIGVRLGSKGMFVEPAVGVAWANTSIDNLGTAAQRLEFEQADSLKARIGARFGGTTAFSGGDALTIYASGNLVRQFGDDYALTVTAGESQRIEGARLGTYGEGRLGVSYRTAGGFDAFIEGQAEFGSGYDGLSGRAGFRIGF